MARGRKKEITLTPEEKLAQAWVPKEERPFNVPGNWCWVRLGVLGYTNIGLTYRPSDINNVGTIVLRSSNIQNGKMDYNDVVRVAMDIPESKMSQKGDILIRARNGSKSLVGKTAIVDSDGMSYGAFMAIFRSQFNLLIFHYLNSHYFRSIIDRDVGTSTINQVTQALIKELPFPLPPRAEQKRIVDRIEYLFAKLDEAKEKAQYVLDSFETRKAAILHKAFTGELTARWRAAHSLDIASWKNLYLKDICDYMKAGGDKPVDFVDEQDDVHCIPVVANGISNEGIIGYSAESKYDGETVTVSGRGTIGYSIYRNYSYYPVVRLIVLGPKKDVYAKFLKYAFDAFPEEGTGSSIPQLTVPMIKEKVIPVPCIEEQAEIVRIIDSLFVKEQQAKKATEAVLEKIDLLKKSILARAFRGELGTNDPTEESALKLLKEILKGDI